MGQPGNLQPMTLRIYFGKLLAYRRYSSLAEVILNSHRFRSTSSKIEQSLKRPSSDRVA